MDPNCFDADPDPAQNIDADPDPYPDPGGGGGQPKVCIPPGKILGTPLTPAIEFLRYLIGTAQAGYNAFSVKRPLDTGAQEHT